MADKPTKEQRRRWAAKRRQDAVYNSGAVGKTLPRSGAKSGSGSSSGRTLPGSPVGGNVFDPNSYVPAPALGNPNLPIWAQPGRDTDPDPDAAKPLPQGRGFEAGYINDLNAARMQQNSEFRANPQAYAEANDRALNTEQSLLDKGMSMLGRIFNYEDEADLNLFGIPLAPVESGWDKMMRHFTGAYDLLSIGIGGLLSAAPGGIPTLSYDELSAGKTVGEVLNGEIGLLDNAAPTPGQIFTASIAVEAKRIREGGARASDILLANPATGPFILAALAAETSPLQQDGFDIRDPEKRKQAFGSGFEQWGSGAFDFGIQFADPAIAAGIALKAARVGMMGAKSPLKYALASGRAVRDGFNEIAARKGWATWEDTGFVNGFRRADGTAKYTRLRTRLNEEEVMRRTAADVYDVSGPVARERARLRSADPEEVTQRPLLDLPDEFWNDALEDGAATRAGYEAGDLPWEQMEWLTGRAEEWAQRNIDLANPTPLERVFSTNPENPADNNEFWDDLSDMFTDEDRMYYQRLRDEGVDTQNPPDPTDPAFANYERDFDHMRDVEDLYDRWLIRKSLPEYEDMSMYPGGGLIDREFNARTLRDGDVNPDDLRHPMARIIARLTMKGEDGRPKMTVKEIMKMPEIRNLPAKGAIAKMLYSINDPYEMGMVIAALSGDPGAVKALNRWAPALGDDVYAFWHEQIVAARATMEPATMAEARGMMDHSIQNLQFQISEFQKKAKGAPRETQTHYQTRIDRLQKSIDQFEALKEVLDGKRIDPLVPTSPYYDPERAMRILRDMYRRQDIVQTATRAEVKNAFARMDMDRRFAVNDNWYARMVTDSRFRRARAAYEYGEEGGNLIPKRVLVRTTIGDTIDPEDARKVITPEYKRQGWLAPSKFEGTSRFQRAARVWRWFGTATPAGYIGLKGTAAMGSENELLAVLDGLDIYKGNGVEVIVKNEDGTLADPISVGGAAEAAKMVNLFTEALRDPTKDPLDALMAIEKKIQSDMSTVYGYDPNKLNSAIAKANGFRASTIEEIQRHGFFVDPDDGEIHHVPWLRTNLANGTYMHNWQDLERSLKRWATSQYGSEFAQRGRLAAERFTDIAIEADTMFQNFWRPATLLRLSYTQRNVFEGMLRAMAFYSSVAPLTWPVKAVAYGVESKIRKAVVKRSADGVSKRIATSGVRSVMNDYQSAKMELAALLSAFEDVDEAGAVVYRVSRRHLDEGERYENLWPGALKGRTREAREKVAAAETALKDAESKFDALVDGTRFGKWRKKNLEEITRQRAEYNARVNQVHEMLDDMKGVVPHAEWAEMNDQATDLIAAHLAQVAALDQMEFKLRYVPMDGLNLYRSKAGRARRIGSGTSVGPDGNRYNDAWNDSYENINRSQMSADLTTRQTLSAESDFKGNIFSRMLLRENEAIPYTPATQDDWVHGMVDVITRNSFNPLVHRLFAYDFDVTRVVDWLMETPQGQQEMLKLQMLMGDYRDPKYVSKKQDPLKAAAYTQKPKPEDGPRPDPRITRSYQPGMVDANGDVRGIMGTEGLHDVFDLSRLEAYVTDVAQSIRQQMQDNPAFFALQERANRRTLGQASGQRTRVGDPEPVSADDVWDVLNNQLTPEERAKLGVVQGSRLIDMGTPKITEIWSKYVNKMFRAIGTIPEDAVVRGPFYAKRFKQVRNSLIELYWQQQGKTPAQVKRQLKEMRTQEGRPIEGTLAHDQFEIPAGELSDIYTAAHYQALRDTRDWMYTIERRTKLGKYGEFIFPFISASQNSATVGGRLLWKNPWILPIGIDLWRAPTRLGWEDEEGNLKMPMPFEWVKETLADNPWIPVLGGAVGRDDMITIPKDGLNVFMPDTGFGVVPRPGVFVQVGASELMKAGAFPVEPPGILKAAMGEEDALQTWTMLKDYVFGSQDTMSTKFLSWDKAAPAWVKRVIESKDEMSNQYGYLFSMNWASENQRYYAGLRDDKPTEKEIHERTTNGFWFMALGNVGVPTPLTPYPILTRPDVNKVQIQFLQERWQAYQKAYPQDAAMNFMEDYGDLMLPLAQTKVSKNVGGAAADVEAVSDIKTLDPVIREITPLLGDDGLEMLDIVVNNRSTLTDYDESAYQWERTATIGGTSRKWRESQSPEEAEQERNRLAGWTEYQAFMDGLDARLYSAGLSNYEQAGAVQFKLAKERFLLNMADRDDRKGWYMDYLDTGGARTQKAIVVLEKSVSNDTFRRHMVEAGKEATLAAMDEYVYYRRSLVQSVRESGLSLSADENSDLKAAWLNIRQRLANGDERFATIMNRWLAGDEDPTFPGNYLDTGGTDG